MCARLKQVVCLECLHSGVCDSQAWITGNRLMKTAEGLFIGLDLCAPSRHTSVLSTFCVCVCVCVCVYLCASECQLSPEAKDWDQAFNESPPPPPPPQKKTHSVIVLSRYWNF